MRVKNKDEKYQRILEKKINTKVEEICKELPKEFITFLQYVRGLQYEEKPDYGYLKKLIEIISDKNNFLWDFGFDFSNKIEMFKKNEIIVKTKKYGIKDKDHDKYKENYNEEKIGSNNIHNINDNNSNNIIIKKDIFGKEEIKGNEKKNKNHENNIINDKFGFEMIKKNENDNDEENNIKDNK